MALAPFTHTAHTEFEKIKEKKKQQSICVSVCVCVCARAWRCVTEGCVG